MTMLTDSEIEAAYKEDQGMAPFARRIEAMVLAKEHGRLRDLRERLAELCHEQWAGWMRYLFGKCEPCYDDNDRETGQLAIPCWGVERWKRQLQSLYCHLSPDEQDSDRREADKFLSIILAES